MTDSDRVTIGDEDFPLPLMVDEDGHLILTDAEVERIAEVVLRKLKRGVVVMDWRRE